MTKTIFALSVFVTFLPAIVLSRPVDLKDLRLDSQIASVPRSSENRSGVFTTASQGTTYFGGTIWNPDSMRWEAMVGGTWTFDSGVGSFIIEEDPNNLGHPKPYPNVNPYKQIGLHGAMEGWTGIDFTYGDFQRFRRLGDTDPRWGDHACVGSGAGLGGQYSFWAGVLQPEADSLCWGGGQGYGNSWNICLFKEYAYPGGAAVTLTYDFVNDTEVDWDFTYVYVDTTGEGDDIEIEAYNGPVSGAASHTLLPGSELPASGGTIRIKFCVRSDMGWSDEDGFSSTDCGAFAVDNITLSGGLLDGPATFETGDDGWAVLPLKPGPGGEWSNLVDKDNLPPPSVDCATEGACSLTDSVLVFEDLTLGGHSPYATNFAVSPWIDLTDAGFTNPIMFVVCDRYLDLPLEDKMFLQWMVQSSTGPCPPRSGYWGWWGSGYLVSPGPTCAINGKLRGEVPLPAGTHRFRIALGVICLCDWVPPCSGLSNKTPWIDNVRVGVYDQPDPGELLLGLFRGVDDAFPENGSLDPTAPARVDGYVYGLQPLGPIPTRGDTLLLDWNAVGLGIASEGYIQFQVFPGPGINTTRLGDFYSRFQDEGDGWYSARMDTAELGGVTKTYSLMTAFHEDDPGFSGSDTDLDPNDLDPNGGMTRLANDMFPDDLFTPGSRLHFFFKTRLVGGTNWHTCHDTLGGLFHEMEVLPSSMGADSTWNCVLYVTTDRDAWVEGALENLLGFGSPNFENHRWDRFDYHHWQATFGRPLGGEHGATLNQALGYTTILWTMPRHWMNESDGNILRPWLALPEVGSNSLYLSGSELVEIVMENSTIRPNTRRLLEDLCGVTFQCGTFHEQDCPPGTGQDWTPCADLNPVAGSNVANTATRSVAHLALGSGCPNLISYDVLGANPDPEYGVARGDEEYAGLHKIAQYASITNDASESGPLTYKTVVDGVLVSGRRDAGACFSNPASDPIAVEERLQEVLTWFGVLGGEMCSDRTAGVSVSEPNVGPIYQTALLPVAPNPLMGGVMGKIRFTLADEARATVEVFDLNGHLVRRVFDGLAEKGPNQATWSGLDDTGRAVASGVYFVRLKTPDRTLKTKMVLIAGDHR